MCSGRTALTSSCHELATAGTRIFGDIFGGRSPLKVRIYDFAVYFDAKQVRFAALGIAIRYVCTLFAVYIDAKQVGRRTHAAHRCSIPYTLYPIPYTSARIPCSSGPQPQVASLCVEPGAAE